MSTERARAFVVTQSFILCACGMLRWQRNLEDGLLLWLFLATQAAAMAGAWLGLRRQSQRAGDGADESPALSIEKRFTAETPTRREF